MNENTKYKIALWQTLSANANELEARNPLTLAVLAFLCAATLIFGLILQSYIIICIAPALAFIVLNTASSNMRKTAALKGYLCRLEKEINEEMQSEVYLWNSKVSGRFIEGSLPRVLAAVLSLAVSIAILGYIVVYMLFINRAQAFESRSANFVFKIAYTALMTAVAAGTVIGFLDNFGTAFEVQRMMDGASPADETWKPPFDDNA